MYQTLYFHTTIGKLHYGERAGYKLSPAGC